MGFLYFFGQHFDLALPEGQLLLLVADDIVELLDPLLPEVQLLLLFPQPALCFLAPFLPLHKFGDLASEGVDLALPVLQLLLLVADELVQLSDRPLL